MYINDFTPGISTWILMRKTQLIQLYANVKTAEMSNFLDSTIKVWNNLGTLMPETTIADLAVFNGDEYQVQVGIDLSTGNYNVVVTIELCDDGSLNPPINVTCVNKMNGTNIQLSALDVTSTTCVKTRNYNSMNIVAPTELPKHSICIFEMRDVKQLQMNNDLMAVAEIFTHSYKILTSGALGTTHPTFDLSGTPTSNEFYTDMSKTYVCGYGDAALDKVIICTGDDSFVLYPNTTCNVVYCQKELTAIAEQVNAALQNSGQRNNVDSQEFAAAVAAVGQEAERQNLTTDKTQALANKVVTKLPSVVISSIAGVKNFNIASESAKKGFSTIVKA